MTIEERADEVARRVSLCGLCRKSEQRECPCDKYKQVYGSYVMPATEQREIDIQRAVEWLKDNADYYLDREEGVFYTSSLVFDFEKAMKGDKL